MFDQAPMNRLNDLNWNLRAENEAQQPLKPESHHGVRHLLADISELVELQARLTANDVQTSLAGLLAPTMLFAGAAIIVLGTIPIVVLAIANTLVVELDWPNYAAQFASGGVAILTAFVMAYMARVKLKKVAAPLKQSANELSKNFGTIRDLLREKEDSRRQYPNYPR
jgi:uncharacterized integral membrane protein